MRHLRQVTSPRPALTPDQTVRAFYLDVLIAILGQIGRRKGV